MMMNDQNLIRLLGFHAKPKAFFAFFSGLFFSVFLISAAYAEVKSQEPELLGVLENDLRVETNQAEPNLMTPEVVPLNDNVVVKEDAAKSHETGQADSENDLLVAKGPTTLIERQLWKARLNAFEEKEASQSRHELQAIIQRVNSVQFKPKPPVEAAPEVPVEMMSKTEPNETTPDAAPPEKQGKKLPDGYVSEKTLQMLDGMLQHSEQTGNMLELAETLFHSGCLKEAAGCYQQALERKRADETDPFQDKAWILLQLGNCLQNDNPQAALENYRAVIVECPDSPWVPLAKAKSELANWYLQDQPKSLLQNVQPQIN